MEKSDVILSVFAAIIVSTLFLKGTYALFIMHADRIESTVIVNK